MIFPCERVAVIESVQEHIKETYKRPYRGLPQTSKMECFTKKTNGFAYLSILDICSSIGCPSGTSSKLATQNTTIMG